MRRILFLIVAGLTISAPALAQEANDQKEVPPSIQKKYNRRLEEMKMLDKNKDGVLQAEELQGSVENKFDAADKNQDGILSPEEKQTAIGAFKNQAQETYGNTTDRRAKRLENRYNNADANEDGQVSKEEYDAYFGGRYEKFDRDGNGVITEKEYRTDVEKLPRSYSRTND